MFSQDMFRGGIVVGAVLGMCSATAFARQEPCISDSATITGLAAFGGQAIRMSAEIAGEGRR
jgi:branched-chain amino acid transport system substrate-binding protein